VNSTFNNKKVLITGHTGFKGTWLVHLLHKWGAKIYGYSLAPLPHQILYTKSNANDLCEASVFNTIDDLQSLQQFVNEVQPDFVFHLAAQPLVIESYHNPVGTFMTNVMGTVHILEALKTIHNPCTAIMITTDKVYQNDEDGRLYVESDKLGGKDPYSASKACDEIVIHSYIHSYFNPSHERYNHIRVASVRAGNVIGGGDYADNRIIPDLVRAIEAHQSATIRHPYAIRPWQHVLEPLMAYCMIVKRLEQDSSISGAYNIGPYETDMLEVQQIVELFHKYYGAGTYNIVQQIHSLHEAQTLKLNNNKIKEVIGFQPRLNAATAIQWTAEWYKDHHNSFRDKCLNDIDKYLDL